MGNHIKKLAALLLAATLLLAGCASNQEPAAPQEPTTANQESAAPEEPTTPQQEPVTILIAAAASLEYSLRDELIPLFQEKYPHIIVGGTYDSSGKLQTQIEEGMEADLFLSAGVKQMDALADQGLIAGDSVVPLLENKIVLIQPVGGTTGITSFAQVTEAAAIALGDPESVPVGQYAKEVFESLGTWDAVSAKASFGGSVTEVLSWVAEGSADLGVVYATDAATTDQVEILSQAPEGSLAKPVIYPAGMVAATAHPEEAQLFLDFLQSPEAQAVFSTYGFTPGA